MEVSITALNIFPVKSLGGITLDSAELTEKGLKYDRNWVIVDHAGVFLTQRQCEKMATISTTLTDLALVLSAPGHQSLEVPLALHEGEYKSVTVWKDTCDALYEGEVSSHWLTSVLGSWNDQPVSLMRLVDGKTVRGKDLKDGTSTSISFADGYPLLITSNGSLESLNGSLIENGAPEVGMERFRANVVIAGPKLEREDRFSELSSKSYSLKMVKPCQRCKIITIDQERGEIPVKKEPLKTLVKVNPFSDNPGAFFGENAIVANGIGAQIAVGDKLILS